jgi:MYXO-CTERM domain-containing protein
MYPMSPACTRARHADLLAFASVIRRALLVTLVVGLSWAPTARAQVPTDSGVSAGTGGISLAANGIDRTGTAYSQTRPWWISRADCIANEAFIFSPSLTTTSDPVEVWAGTGSCVAERSDTTDRGQCWIVARVDRPDDRPRIEVPVRNVVARRTNTEEVPLGLPASVCDVSTDPSGEQLSFFLMIVDGGEAVGSVTWDGGREGTGFDTLGPEPPGSISVGIGESQLAIVLDDVAEDSDLERFEAFCVPEGTEGPAPIVPSRTTQTVGDAGVTTTSPGSSTPAPADCATPIMATGARPPDGFSCGIVSKEATKLSTDKLVNETTYAVGITGQDILGNTGVVSDIQCGTPTELNDFFELYAESGGRGGGGFCNLSTGPTGGSRQPIAWLGLLFGGLLWRRVRSRK